MTRDAEFVVDHRETCGDPNPDFRRCICHRSRGHHGPHWDDCGATWPNLAELTPCTSTQWAVLGVVGDPALVRCGLLEGHDSEHRFVIIWTESEPTPIGRTGVES
jgi:hypothetical protein